MVKALDFQSRGPVLKTTVWLQGRLSLSSFRRRSNDYQESLGTCKSKLRPRSDSVALRELNPIRKKVP